MTVALFSAMQAHALDITNFYSPLNTKRPFRSGTRYIILHTTEGKLDGSLRKVHRYGEAHYFVAPSGKVFRIIHRKRIATHTGRSMWKGKTNLDDISLGIEVVGFHDQDITAAQYNALRQLLRQLKKIYRIRDENILTHCMVAYGRPNAFHHKKHRGRKRCGMILSHPDARRRLGLSAGPKRDPDVAAKRLAVADPDLHRFLYKPPKVVAALAGFEEQHTMIITRGNNAWRIARDRYNSPETLYVYPDGTKFRGNEIREWDNIPAGTRVSFLDQDREREQEFEGFLEIGKDGKTSRDLAGDLYADASTIYFFPDGLIRTGAELNAAAPLRRILKAPPKGTRVLVGYIYGGYVQKGRSARRIAGIKWNYPSTFYRFPDGRILSGDDIGKKPVPNRTLIFMMK